MDGQAEVSEQGTDQQVQADPWALAFEAVNKEAKKNIKEAPEGQHSGSNDESDKTPGEASEGDNENTNSNDDVSNEGALPEGNNSGDDLLPGDDTGEIREGDQNQFNLSEINIDEFKESVRKEAESQAMNDVARMFIDKGIRHRNGVLGARIDDPDIMKYDDDGVPHFYNPDTKQEFTGDNPRRQAKEWCDDYNAELAPLFNNYVGQQVENIINESSKQIAVLEFAETYENLDPIRQSMFDSLIEDYEVKDNEGKIIGYSCDLNSALQAVNRQVSKIQEYSRSQNPQQGTTSNNNGPALDMKSSANSGGSSNEKPKFKNEAEAMEYLQNMQLEKMRNKK